MAPKFKWVMAGTGMRKSTQKKTVKRGTTRPVKKVPTSLKRQILLHEQASGRCVWLVHHAIPVSECRDLISEASSQSWEQSALGEGVYAVRTSENCEKRLDQLSVGKRVERRLEKLIRSEVFAVVGHETEQIERFQITRYGVNAQFALHVDQCFANEPGCVEEREDMGGRREISVIAYLNDDFEGGQTHFPHHNLCVQPRRGSVLFFTNLVEGEVDARQQHASLPVERGTKWIVVVWTRDAKPPS